MKSLTHIAPIHVLIQILGCTYFLLDKKIFFLDTLSIRTLGNLMDAVDIL